MGRRVDSEGGLGPPRPGPRFHFFAGKGGVGKTTCAAAAAVGAAERGRRVLLVSTDPAHSLGDALTLAGRASPHRAMSRPRRVPTRRGVLEALEMDADRALERWITARRRHLRTLLSRATYLDDDDIDRFLRLSLPGVDELIGLLELDRVARARAYDEVVVDTAPTGHTVRLLAMPATLGRLASVLDEMQGKHRFLAESLGGEARPDAADAIVDEMAAQSEALSALLRDPVRSTFTWILLPEALALEEARDGVAALETAGIPVAEILVNRVTPEPPGPCALCEPRRAAERAVVTAAVSAFADRVVGMLPALDTEPRGVPALREVAALLHAAPDASPALRRRRRAAREPASGRRGPRAVPDVPGPGGNARSAIDEPAPAWLARLAPPGLRLLLVAGKGGVGKTSCAAALALALAEREREGDVLLMSTDPAHSVADVLALDAGIPPGAARVPGVRRLHVLEVDAAGAFEARRERYRTAVDELFAAITGGSRFDVAFDRTVLKDLIELAPPGLDELFGVLSVIEALFPAPGGPRHATVVLDTAPTGHALRLLAMPAGALEWVHALLEILLKYRQVIGLGELGADLLAIARDLRRLQALLTDPAQARLLVVTRPAALPVLETRRLLRATGRLGLPLGAVLVNEVTPPGCARCRRQAAVEARALAALRRAGRSHARRGCVMIVAPAVAPPPRGVRALAGWRARWELET